jgi:NAD(P)-dependent dehydrogenase (short-subunit alcohol dehydrogenase family)
VELRGASALVTGAGRGIGRAIALALAREGAKVAAVARTVSDLDAVVAEVHKGGGTAAAIPGDLRDPAFPARAVELAVAAHGRLRVLVNNAGVGAFANLLDTTDEMWDRVIGTNLTAVFRLTRAALPHLANGGGQVFMVSSLAGQNAIAGLAAYCASKAALDHLAACLMLEVRAQGVKVTVIAPGSVDTGFAGMPRGADTSWMLRGEDIAATVVELLRARDGAHLSRVEMRPAQPQKRG